MKNKNKTKQNKTKTKKQNKTKKKKRTLLCLWCLPLSAHFHIFSPSIFSFSSTSSLSNFPNLSLLPLHFLFFPFLPCPIFPELAKISRWKMCAGTLSPPPPPVTPLLSGDQNEVFEYLDLVLQSLLLKANFRKSNCQDFFFPFQDLTFTVSSLRRPYRPTKAFSLWRKQKYHQRGI